jgi:hypothetical protein
MAAFRAGRLPAGQTSSRWACGHCSGIMIAPGTAGRRRSGRSAPGDVPGPVPDQQRHVHRHQRAGGPEPGATWAGWPRCRSWATWWAGRCPPGPGGAINAAAPLGRRKVGGRSFQLGAGGGLLSALLCAYAAWSRNFWLLVHGHGGGGLLQRQWPAVPLCRRRTGGAGVPREGGVAGDGRRLDGRGAGPNLASAHAHLFEVPFAGAYLALAVVALLSMAVMAFVQFPPVPPNAAAGRRRAAPVARSCASRCSSWRLARRAELRRDEPADGGHAAGHAGVRLAVCDAALVLEWHVIGMFAPGFFTGHLIKRFGTLPIMGGGRGAEPACIAVALSGVDLHQFMVRCSCWAWAGTSCSPAAPRCRCAPTARGKRPRAGRHQLLRVRHHGLHLVCLGRAGHHAGLDAAEPGLAAAGGAHRPGDLFGMLGGMLQK